jgi:hypothetical protein
LVSTFLANERQPTWWLALLIFLFVPENSFMILLRAVQVKATTKSLEVNTDINRFNIPATLIHYMGVKCGN